MEKKMRRTRNDSSAMPVAIIAARMTPAAVRRGSRPIDPAARQRIATA